MMVTLTVAWHELREEDPPDCPPDSILIEDVKTDGEYEVQLH